MAHQTKFDLNEFMPYLLNQAADAASSEFAAYYKSNFGMLRTEWRVLFHLGRYEKMTAKEICDRSRIHKTKVSRAVSALQDKGYLKRTPRPDDRRHETLELTTNGNRVFAKLCVQAERFDRELLAPFSDMEKDILRLALLRLAQR